MRSYSFVIPTVVFTSWFAGCASPNATGAGATPPAKNEAVEGLFPTLTKGMTAEVIRQKMGAPAVVEPMQPPEGHAEVWVYRFEKDLGMVRRWNGIAPIPEIVPGPAGLETRGVPQPNYSIIEEKASVTLRLLMIDGALVAQKAMVENGTTPP